MIEAMMKQNQERATRYEARKGFERLAQQGWLRQLYSKASGRSHTLLSLKDVSVNLSVQTRSHLGVRLVPITQIKGSEGRYQDFDASFRPLNNVGVERWVSVACAFHEDVPLPLVELIQVEDSYYVRDGHHRISVARWLGQQEIEAEVTVWHCRTTSADLPSPTPALPATRMAQRPVHLLASLVTKAGERLLAVLQKVQPLTQRTLTQSS